MELNAKATNALQSLNTQEQVIATDIISLLDSQSELAKKTLLEITAKHGKDAALYIDIIVKIMSSMDVDLSIRLMVKTMGKSYLQGLLDSVQQ